MSNKKKTKYVPIIPVPEEVKETPKKFNIKAKTDGQQDLIETIDDCDIIVCNGPAGSGKALSLDSKIYTPDGFILNKDIKIGDFVKTPNNKVAKVTGVYPQELKDMYKITFKDGTFVKCCKEHLWLIKNRKIDNKKERLVNTEYIINNFTKNNEFNLSISASEPIQFTHKKTLIHPYIMGILLSEGGLNKKVSFTTADNEVLNNINFFLKKKYITVERGNCTYEIIKNCKTKNKKNIYRREIVRLNLNEKRSYEKFIPVDYLYGSISQRKYLLQGLMDGDGTVCKNSGTPIYYTTSEELKDNMVELVASLGGTCTINTKIPHFTYKGEKKTGRLCYILHLCLPNNIKPFSLSRKLNLVQKRTTYKPNRLIRNVEYIGKGLSQCISIDSPEKMYLTNNFIKTHNTYMALAKGFEALKSGKVERLILARPLEECGKGIGFLPGELEEKLSPHVRAFTELFSHFCHPKEIEEYIKKGMVQIDTIEYMRGLTFHKSFIIVDEAQNCTYNQLKMLLTRLGHKSKLIINGDLKQTDLPEKMWYKDNGIFRVPLDFVMDKLDLIDVENIGIVELHQEDVVRHGLIKLICGVLP